MLPQKTPDGYRVIYCKVLDSEPARYIQTIKLKIFDMVYQLCLQQNGMEEGQIIIMDMDGIVFGHVGRLSLMTTKIYLHYLQVRQKQTIFICNLVINFINKKMIYLKNSHISNKFKKL